MISAFGVEHGEDIAKAKRDKRHASGAAIAGAGGVTAGAGLLAGGIPGTRSNADALARWKASGASEGGRVRQKASAARAKAPTVKAFPGGIFGYRTSAHTKFTEKATGEHKYHSAHTPTSKLTHGDAFMRGRAAGKLPPEEQVIRQLKKGRKIGTAALIGGTAVTAYGVKRAQGQHKKVSKAERHTEKYHGALLGAGLGGAGISHAGAKIAGSQQKKWAGQAARSQAQANRAVPKFKGISDEDLRRKPKRFFRGVSREQAEEAGKHRGAAVQQKYFSRVYGTHAKVFRGSRYAALGVAGIGAGGLATTRMKNKRSRVSKAKLVPTTRQWMPRKQLLVDLGGLKGPTATHVRIHNKKETVRLAGRRAQSRQREAQDIYRSNLSLQLKRKPYQTAKKSHPPGL